jgi:phosphate transport system substrate-binding protein
MAAFTASGMDEDATEEACMKLRTDGRNVDIDGDYTETLARLDADKNAIGVFGLSFYQNNTDKLRVATMGGVVPSAETVASGDYPVSRPLYFYVKKAHIGVIPGLPEFMNEYVSDKAIGAEGYLTDRGLDARTFETREFDAQYSGEQEEPALSGDGGAVVDAGGGDAAAGGPFDA